MQLTSPAFAYGETIPIMYTQFGDNVNPRLEIRDVPAHAKSLAILVEDPDVPEAAGVPVWDHWVVFNIPPTVTEIPERWMVDGVRGKGTRGSLDYSGPRPPDREHRYFFKLFALDTLLTLPEGSSKAEVLSATENHVIASVELMGLCAPQQS